MPVVEATPHSDDGKPAGPNSSEDGKGGTTPAGPRYIYYRLYTKYGPLESNNPIYSNDRFISRVPSRLVRPPHTAGSLKKHLCRVEGLSTSDSFTLYQSLSETTGLEDSTRLSFRGALGPGLSDRDPVALVTEARTAEKRSNPTSTVDPQNLLERDYQEHYVYYIAYDEGGGTVSKTSFDENNPHLGRVNTLFIPPPHTVASLKHHLIKCEKIAGHNIQLFQGEDSELPMDDDDPVALLTDTFPGFIEDQPIAITYESQGNISPIHNKDPTEVLAGELAEARSALDKSQQELSEACSALEESQQGLAQLREELENAKEKLNDAAFKQGASPAQLKALSERPSFTKKLLAKIDPLHGNYDSTWHKVNTGDVFYTDGISRKEKYIENNLRYARDAYSAIDSSGRLAFVWNYPSIVTFC